MSTQVATLLEPPAPPAQDPTTQKARLDRMRRMFEESFSASDDSRREAKIDVGYYHTKQFTPDEKAALADRDQPDIAFNRVKPAVNGIIGVTERSRSDPKAYPRDQEMDVDSADVATDVLRYIADKNRFHRTKQSCFRSMLVPGTMAAIVQVNSDRDVEITEVRWDEFFADPRSRREDFSDARYKGIAKWLYADDIVAMYPHRASEIHSAVDAAPMSAAEARDKPETLGSPTFWGDRRARRMLVVEIYYRESAQWNRCVFIGSTILEEGPSPYLDEKKRPTCPIEAQSAYVDDDLMRYGVVRDMRGPQDELNKRRSKLLHLLSVSQIEVADPSAIDVDAEVARIEAAKPDGVIPYGWRKVSTADMASGQAALLAEAKAEIERMGPNPAVLGRGGEDTSGRALLARQQAGLVELALLFGALEDWELRIYRQCWARVKQYWTEPQVIRVTDDEDAPKFIGINKPIKGLVQDPMTGQVMEGVLGYENAVAELDVDIVLDTTPDTGTLAQEQFAVLTQLAGTNPEWAAEIPFEMFVRMSGLPHAKRVLDQIKKHKEENAAAQEEQKAEMKRQIELAVAAAIANIEKTRSETEKNLATAQATTIGAVIDARATHADYAIDGFQAGLDAAQQPPPGAPNGATGAPL